jgi:hypothetical protein
VILYCERPIVTDGIADFYRPDIVHNRMNEAALVTDVVVPVSHNLSNAGAEKIGNIKMWPCSKKYLEA